MALQRSPALAFISHHTAATLQGMWAPASPQIHVTCPSRAGRSLSDGIQTHRGHPDAWVVPMRDLRLSAPVQVVVELARVLPLVDLVPLIDSLFHRGLATASELRSYVDFRDVRSRRLEQALTLARHGSESAMESKTRLLLVWAGFPEPKCQWQVVVPWDVLTEGERTRVCALLASRTARFVTGEGVTFRLDLAYPHLQLAIEYDGDHHTEPEQMEFDAIRRSALSRIGWACEIATSSDLMSSPWGLLQRLAASYDSRSTSPVILSPAWRNHFVDWNRPNFAGPGGVPWHT